MNLKEVNNEIIRLKVEELTLEEIATQLNVKIDHVEKIIDRDIAKAKSNPRYSRMVDMYEDGYTLDEIGKKYKITRERVRQCIKREIGYQLGYGPREQEFRKLEIETAVRAVVQISREDRQGDTIEEKLQNAESKGINYKYFDSIRKYCSAAGIQPEALKIYRPDIYKELKINQTKAKQRWSTYYDACRMCGKTTAKHRSNGYCMNCYAKSPEWKEMVKLSYQRNKESRKQAWKKYSEEYYSRPEIIEKQEKDYDEKFFGGNRKKALERDGYKCVNCGMTMDLKDKSGRPRVRVWHLNGDNKDHSLSNLGTYCQSCIYKLRLGRSWGNFGKGRSI